MNHILNYRGFRFFQSSYDKDEQGTYLSVNHDFWGTWISYIGYILLTIGMVAALFSKKSRFTELSRRIKTMRTQTTAILILLCCGMAAPVRGQQMVDSYTLPNVVIPSHAEKFSELVVQDFKGRMKPVHTLSRELLRKIARKESLYNLTADQIVLSMYANGQEWGDVPLIKVSKEKDLQELIGIEGEMASFSDFFDQSGSYKLRDEVQRAYNLQPIDRGVREKELMKIDERVNIASMIYSGSIFKIIPIPNDPSNTWTSIQVGSRGGPVPDVGDGEKFLISYLPVLRQAVQSGDFVAANKVIDDLAAYQAEEGAAVMPSTTKINAEKLLNNLYVLAD